MYRSLTRPLSLAGCSRPVSLHELNDQNREAAVRVGVGAVSGGTVSKAREGE